MDTQTQPSPTRILDTINGYKKTASLKAALELDVFTAIGEGATTADAISTSVKASPRGVRMLCDYLASMGFLSHSNGGYTLTPESKAYLDRHSPRFLGDAAFFIASPTLEHAYDLLTDAVRRGGTALLGSGTCSSENPIWIHFANSMAPMACPGAETIARLMDAEEGNACKTLDIAAGHGLYGLTIAKHNPRAHVYAVDWDDVLEVAALNAMEMDLTDRWHRLPGSAFEVDLGSGYDLVLVTNFLHHFGRDCCLKVLRRVREAMAPGGRMVTLEFVPDEERQQAHDALAFALTMLATTPEGDAYTFSELDSMFREAGFGETQLHDLATSAHKVLITKMA